MNTIDALLSENSKFKFVKAVFNPNAVQRQYTYKTTFDIEEGDIAIVETNDGFKTVYIKEVLDPLSVEQTSFDIKWLVQVVNTEDYEAAKELEKQVRDKVIKAQNKVTRQRLIDSTLSELDEQDKKELTGLVRL